MPRPIEEKRAYFRQYYARNRERLLAYQKQLRLRRIDETGRTLAYEQNRHYWLKREYRLSLEEYEQAYAAQGGRCAICGSDAPQSGSGCLEVDHDHGTGAVRGLLCSGCNAGLGRFRDNTVALAAAIKYLNPEQP